MKTPIPKATNKGTIKSKTGRKSAPNNSWPKWREESEFSTKNFHFSCSVVDYSTTTNQKRVSLLKDREFINHYKELIARIDPKRVFEIGFFRGACRCSYLI